MTKRLILSHVPLWFGAVFALVYITGYFIDFFQHSIHGIVDSGEDILKLRYIQIGINFFILFSAIVAPVFFLLFGRKRMQPITGRHPNDLPAISATASFATVAYFLIIYYATIFTPPGYFYSDAARLWLLFSFSLSVPVGALILMWLIPLLRTQRIERRHAPEARSHALRKLNADKELYYKWYTTGALIYALVVFLILFYKRMPDILEMMSYGVFFFLFCFLFTLIAYRMVLRLEGSMMHLTQFARFGYVTMFVLMLIFVFYLAVASYAYAIFPHIPSLKGGAHYLSSPVVSVKLQPPISEDGIGPPVEDPEMSRMVVIYSSSNSVYVADACQWRQNSRTTSITQINRRVLRYIVVNPEKPIRELDCPAGK